MAIQENDIGRILIIYIPQLLVSVIFLSLAYKILKRNRNQLTLILSGFYISEAVGFIVNAIYVPLRVNPLVNILYFIALYLILFGPIFLILFNISLLKKEYSYISTNKIIIIISIYAIAIFFILLFPGGLIINDQTNWRPIWNWSFLILIYLFMSFVILLPFTFLTYKLYKLFEDKGIKKRLKLFFIGFLGVAIALYGAFLYNTWYNLIFRTIWNIIAMILIISSILLIYYAWIHQL